MILTRFRQRSTAVFPAGWRHRRRLALEGLEDRTLLDASPATSALAASYGQLPLSFESNQGQTDPAVNFLSRGPGYGLFLTPTEAVLSLRQSAPTGSADPAPAPDVLRLQFLGANATPQVVGLDPLPGTSNYLIGNDPAQWHTHIANYGKVEYQDVYLGIDLVYYGNQRQLEYDFVVAAGADPGVIRLAFTGQQGLELDGQGNLVLHTAGGDVVQQAPVVYQEGAAGREAVAGRYVLDGQGQVGFAVGAYDASRPLIIDPILSYSTYLGGNGNDEGFGIAVDSAGNAYVTGQTRSTNFPTANPMQFMNGGGFSDAFVTKLNAAGTALVYSTYLGGNVQDQGTGIAVDSAGNAYVTGFTNSTNFPTANAFQSMNGGGGNTDAFVAKLNAAGTALSYSTYLGGNDSEQGNGIAVDSAGNAYVTGFTDSTSFPTVNPLTPPDAFVAKLDAAGALVYSRRLGGVGSDEGNGIAVDSAGNAYVTGGTDSPFFPITPGAFQTTNGGGFDAFVAKLNAAGTALLYSTYLGALEDDIGSGIAVDSAGNAYVTGVTDSFVFPTTPGAFRTIKSGLAEDAFVAKLNTNLSGFASLVYSTFLGGGGVDEGSGIAVDSAGNAYVTGRTFSTNFPTANPLQPAKDAENDAFVTKLNAAGTALSYSTYLGGNGSDTGFGIAVDSASNAYVTGNTFSTNFPTANPLQPAFGGGLAADAFVAKIAENPFTVFSRTFEATEGLPFTGVVAFFVDNRPAPASSYTALVDWGDGSSSAASVMAFDGGFNVIGTHIYAHEGTYAVTVTVLSADGQTITISSTAIVVDARLIPVGKMNIPFTEANPLSRVVASFKDADPGGFAGLYTASINWGDGSPDTPGTISANGSGFDVTGLHTYATMGTYPILVTILDAGGAMTVANSTALVESPPLSGQRRSISVFGNKNFNGVVATFTDPDPRKNPARYSATITWPIGGPAMSMGVITGSNPFTVSASHLFPAFPGTLTITIVVTDLDIPGRQVTILSRVADPPAPAMERVFVGQVYQDLLGRAAEEGGLAHWTGLLEQGRSREAIVQGILGSQEYRERQVRQLYVTYLHREVDPTGLSAFSGLLGRGGTVAQVQALIVGSPEYGQNQGGGTSAGFLDAVYRDALGRQSDAVGRQVFGQALSQGRTPAAVAALIFASDEYRQDWVQAAYGQLLHRQTDATGLAAFTGALRQGMAEELVLAAITGSGEYFDNLELPASF